MERWPLAQNTDQWTARVLFAVRSGAETEMLLALRCGSRRGDRKEWYDERPAVVVLTPKSGTVHLVPLDKDCNDCERLYRIEFSKTYSVAGSQLVELQVRYSDDNPCCDGTDHREGNRLVVLSLPAGDAVLSVVQSSDENSVDDESETDTEWACAAKINYSHDAAGNVERIGTETRCTKDNKPQPDVKKQTFQWNSVSQRFEQLQAPSAQAPTK